MTDEILREVRTIENIEEATCEFVLDSACRTEVQRAQKNVLNNVKEAKDFDTIWKNFTKTEVFSPCVDKCKYGGTGHPFQYCIWKEV